MNNSEIYAGTRSGRVWRQERSELQLGNETKKQRFTAAVHVALPICAALFSLLTVPVAKTHAQTTIDTSGATTTTVAPGAYTSIIVGDMASTGNTTTANQTSGTVTDSGVFTIGNAAGATGVYNLSGTSTLTLSSGATIGDDGNGTFNQSGTSTVNLTGNLLVAYDPSGVGAYNISSGSLVVSGSIQLADDANAVATFSQTGGTVSAASLVLDGYQTTSSGTYTLGGGTLTTGSISNGVSGATSTFNFNGGTLQASKTSTTFMTGLTTAKVQAGGAIINDSTFAITIGQALIHDSALGGTADGGLSLSGTGSLTLTGANTYTGPTAINGGVLQAASAQTGTTSGPLGASGTISFGGGTLQYSSANQFDYSSRFSVVTGPTFNIDTNSQSVTFATAIGGTTSDSLTKLGAGTLTLTAANTYKGGTIINAGILNLGVNSALNTTNGTILFGGGTLQYGTGVTTDYSSRLSTTAGQAIKIDTNGQNVTFATANTATTSTFTKLGAGTLSLISNGNSYTGTTTISAGTLALGVGNTGGMLSPNSAIVDNATLAINRSNAVVQGTDFSTAAITGTGGLTLTAGTLTLNAADTFTGATTVNGGTLVLGGTAGTDIQSSTLTPSGGAVVFSSTVTGNAYTVGGLAGSQNIALQNNAATPAAVALTVGANTATYSGILSGAGSLIVNGTGTQTLSGANTYAGGTTVNNGTVIVNTGGTLGASTGSLAVNAATGITTALNLNVSQTVNGFSGTIAGTGTATVTIASGFTLNSTQSGNTEYDGIIAGAGSLIKDGTGTLSLTNTNSYTGGTTINGGTLAINGPNRLGGTLMINNGTFQFTTINGVGSSITSTRNIVLGNANSTIQVDSGLTYTATTGVLSGTGALNKTGLGTLALQAANTYTGATAVNAGTLLVSGDQTSATGNVSVASGGTLGGGTTATPGIIGGATTVNPGGRITGGTDGTVASNTGTIGTLSFAKALTINGTYVADISNGSTPTSDLLKLTATNTTNGLLSIGTNSTLTIQGSAVPATAPNSTVYVLATYASYTGKFTNANLPAGYALVYTSTQLDLAAIPEPGTWAGGILLVGTFGFSQRRRLKRCFSLAQAA